MSEEAVARAILTLFVESLPLLIPLAVIATLVVGTICHLIYEEIEYRRWSKSQAKKLQAVLTPVSKPEQRQSIQVNYA